MNEQAPSTRFSNQSDVEQIAEYRRFNLPAWIGLFFGFAAFCALISPFLWSVPLVGAVVCGVGLLLAIARENMGGKYPSLLGMTLCCFFLAWAMSSFYFQRSVIYNEAQIVGKQWLQLLIDGEDGIAHQAMLHPTARQSLGLSVDDYYKMDETKRVAKNEMFRMSPASDIIQMGSGSTIQLTENLVQEKMSDLDKAILIRQVYTVSKPDHDPVEAVVTITRQYKDDLGRANWMVPDIEPISAR